jgi:hypothetical protein
MGNLQTFLTAGSNLPFLIAGCIVAAILILEVFAFLIGHSMMLGDSDIDMTADLNGNGIPDYLETSHLSFTGILNPAHVPLMIMVVVLAGTFSIFGYTGQWFYLDFVGRMCPMALSVPLSVMLSFIATRFITVGIAWVMPRDFTSAVTADSLIGNSGVLNIGPVTSLDSGAARFTDQYGTDHYLIVFAEPELTIAQGAPVVLIGPHRDKDFAHVVREISVTL